MSDIKAKIVGTGYCVPEKIRFNDDPIFDYLHSHSVPGQDMFKGYYRRRVLDDDQVLLDIMVPAAKKAIEDSGIDPKDFDYLLGTASVSEFIGPNELFKLHGLLGMSRMCWPIPVDDGFSNFNSALLIADSLIQTGRAKNILICVGGNWTRNVNYKTSQAISAADGAGAIVVSGDPKYTKSGQWTLRDNFTHTETKYYGSMFTQGDKIKVDPPQEGYDYLSTEPYFHIDDQGIEGFQDFGMNAPPACAKILLKKNNILSSEVCLISHQASQTLLDAWGKDIQPGFYFETIKTLANMALANVPVNFAIAMETKAVLHRYIVLLTIGPDMHTNALLLERNM